MIAHPVTPSQDRVLPFIQCIRRHRMLLLALSLYAVSIAVINPMREAALYDDWAYTRVVETVLTTGIYRLDDWLAPHMPAQAAWGALFSAIFGASFTTLRWSTIVLVPLGLVAMAALAKAHDCDDDTAGMLAIGLLAVPLFTQYAFSFNTDVTSLILTLAALAAYSYGLKARSVRWMLWGGIAAALAILTRQTAVALAVGLAIVWLTDAERWRFFGGYAAAGLLPAFGLAALLALNSGGATWATGHVAELQTAYAASGLLPLVAESLWRIAAGSVFLGSYIAPWALALTGIRWRWLLALALPIAITVISGLRADGSGLTPYLPWYAVGSLEARLVLSLASLGAGALLLSALAAHTAYATTRVVQMPAHQRLLLAVTLVQLLLLLLFYKIIDRYLLVFVPFALIAVGVRQQAVIVRRKRLILVAIVFVWISVILWTRSVLSILTAEWSAAEQMRQSGIPAGQVAISLAHHAYHGGFDAYLEAAESPNYDDYFAAWGARLRTAPYIAVSEPIGQVIARIPYDGYWLEPRTLYVIRRDEMPARSDEAPAPSDEEQP